MNPARDPAAHPRDGRGGRRGRGSRHLAARARRLAGAGPLTWLLLAASLTLACYAGVRLLDGDLVGVLVWFVGAALLHDLVFLPLYSLVDRGLRKLLGAVRLRGLLNALRLPAAVSALLLLLWWPLITRHHEEKYARATGLDAGVFLPRWLAVTGALFVLAGLWQLVTRARYRR